MKTIEVTPEMEHLIAAVDAIEGRLGPAAAKGRNRSHDAYQEAGRWLLVELGMELRAAIRSGAAMEIKCAE